MSKIRCALISTVSAAVLATALAPTSSATEVVKRCSATSRSGVMCQLSANHSSRGNVTVRVDTSSAGVAWYGDFNADRGKQHWILKVNGANICYGDYLQSNATRSWTCNNVPAGNMVISAGYGTGDTGYYISANY